MGKAESEGEVKSGDLLYMTRYFGGENTVWTVFSAPFFTL